MQATDTSRRDAVAWHDAECSAFSADLACWSRFCGPGMRVLELGGGTGRVTLAVAALGAEVTTIEFDPMLAAELTERAGHGGHRVEVIAADALSALPAGRFDAVIAPMQFIQMFDEAGRRQILTAVAESVAPGGGAALAIVEPDAMPVDLAPAGAAEPAGAALPDVREREGWVYSSRPLWVTVDAGVAAVTRLRQRVSPSGQMEESVHRDELHLLSAGELEAEARTCGLAPAGREPVSAGPAEADSVVVRFEAGDPTAEDEGGSA